MTKPEKVTCRNPKETRAQNRKSGLTKHKWEAPLERGHAEAARAARHEERDPGAGARVAEGVGRLYVADGVAARAAR